MVGIWARAGWLPAGWARCAEWIRSVPAGVSDLFPPRLPLMGKRNEHHSFTFLTSGMTSSNMGGGIHGFIVTLVTEEQSNIGELEFPKPNHLFFSASFSFSLPTPISGCLVIHSILGNKRTLISRVHLVIRIKCMHVYTLISKYLLSRQVRTRFSSHVLCNNHRQSVTHWKEVLVHVNPLLALRQLIWGELWGASLPFPLSSPQWGSAVIMERETCPICSDTSQGSRN